MPPPRKRPTRRGTYAEPDKAAWTADAYRWKCPECPCIANLRGLLRTDCSRCGHIHVPPEPKETKAR